MLMLELEKMIGKKVELSLITGEKFVCKPLQHLEEEYLSFLVETLEPWRNHPLGTLVEIAETELKAVKPL